MQVLVKCPYLPTKPAIIKWQKIDLETMLINKQMTFNNVVLFNKKHTKVVEKMANTHGS
jgi:hypothetical protein